MRFPIELGLNFLIEMGLLFRFDSGPPKNQSNLSHTTMSRLTIAIAALVALVAIASAARQADLITSLPGVVRSTFRFRAWHALPKLTPVLSIYLHLC